MHEMSLMESTLQMVQGLASEQHIKQVSEVCLRVGELSGAMPDSLQFAFDALKKVDSYSLFRDACLIIEWEDAIAECTVCSSTYHPDRRILLCPACQLPSGRLIQGETLQVLYFEGE